MKLKYKQLLLNGLIVISLFNHLNGQKIPDEFTDPPREF